MSDEPDFLSVVRDREVIYFKSLGFSFIPYCLFKKKNPVNIINGRIKLLKITKFEY